MKRRRREGLEGCREEGKDRKDAEKKRRIGKNKLEGKDWNDAETKGRIGRKHRRRE